LLADLGHELWIGDSAKIRASEVRKQKTDERDAALILDLLLAKRFPKIRVPTPAERDLRQLLWHRHKLVSMRTMLGNQLHALAMSQGLCRKKKLFTRAGRGELQQLHLGPWASRRREELLRLLDQIDPAITEHRPGNSLSAQQADRKLSWAESQRTFQWREAQTGSHQQAGQHHGALAIDRSRESHGAF
jgi:transposase